MAAAEDDGMQGMWMHRLVYTHPSDVSGKKLLSSLNSASRAGLKTFCIGVPLAGTVNMNAIIRRFLSICNGVGVCVQQLLKITCESYLQFSSTRCVSTAIINLHIVWHVLSACCGATTVLQAAVPEPVLSLAEGVKGRTLCKIADAWQRAIAASR